MRREEVVALSGHPGSLSGGAGDLALAEARAYADAAPAKTAPAQSRVAVARRAEPMESIACATRSKRSLVCSEKSM